MMIALGRLCAVSVFVAVGTMEFGPVLASGVTAETSAGFRVVGVTIDEGMAPVPTIAGEALTVGEVVSDGLEVSE
jgi:hypothetical protein